MCVPISVLTKGQVNGCQGFCTMLPQAGAVVGLGAALAWNVTHGKTAGDDAAAEE